MRTTTRIRRIAPRAFLLAALGLSFFPSGARADSKLDVARTAWFWSSNQDVTTSTSALPPPAPPVSGGASGTGGVFGGGSGVASPISPGHFGVAMKNGSSDMRAYLAFDLSTIPTGSTINSFVVTLSVSQGDQGHGPEHATFSQSGQGHAPATANPGAAAIVACAVTQPFADNVASGGGGDPPYSTTIVPPTDSEDGQMHQTTNKNEPATDCSLNSAGTPAADGKTWSFDITNIARAWAAGTIYNEGIALLPQNNSVSSSWTIEFHGPALKLDEKTGETTFVTAVEAPVVVADFTPGDGTTPPPPPPVESCCSVPPATIDLGPASPPIDFGTGTETPPQSDGGTSTVTPTVPVAFAGATPGWVFGLFPLLLLGLALISRVVGVDTIGLATATSGGGRIASTLHVRRLAGEPRVEAAEKIAAEEFGELER